MSLTVMLQEPRRLVVDALAALLDHEPDLSVVLAVTDPADLVARAPLPVDIAVISAQRDDRELARTVRSLRVQQRDLRVLGTVRRAVSASVSGSADRQLVQVVSLAAGTRSLLRAIRGEHTAVAPICADADAHSARPSSLTARERTVLGLLADGLSAQEASEHLRISRKTVENHKQRIFSKLDVQSQAHAVALAMRSGALDAAPLNVGA